MSGMKHTPEADIAELRNLLNEQYVASSVLKELIQNADDSRATTIVICSHPGIKNPSHPLLGFPALLIINDGNYVKKDYEAIPFKGVGAKGDNKEAVGKFGQGLKSVFHLCEAFFFLGSQNQEAMSAQAYDPILNPWQGSRHHEDWFGSDNQSVVAQVTKVVSSVIPDIARWFCLWIPLRTAEVHGATSPISHSYPNADEMCNVSNAPQIAAIMPMLKAISLVNVKQALPNGDINSTYSLIRSDNAESRTAYRSAQGAFSASEFGGKVTFSAAAGASWVYEWHATEQLTNLPKLNNLKEDAKWPEITSIDENGETVTRKDKADQHVAVVFGKFVDCTEVKPGLSITDAVFLPLNIKETMVWPSALTLMMHGYFFVDSGRNALVKRPESGQSPVKYDWNEQLRQCLQYPLLLQALSNAHRALQLTNNDVMSTTEQINEHFKGELGAVCGEWSWLPARKPDGLTVEWRLVSKMTEYLEVPKPTDRLAPFKLIPALEEVAARRILVQQGDPRITAMTPGSLLPELPLLIASFQEKWIAKSGRKYILDGDGLTFLGAMLNAYQPLDGPTRVALEALLRSVLAEIDLKSQRDSLTTLIGLLQPTRLLYIPEEVVDSLGIDFRSLVDVCKSRLAIPSYDKTSNDLKTEEAELLLAWSSQQNMSDRAHWLLGGFVFESLRGTNQSGSDPGGSTSLTKCFPLTINERREMLSLSEIRDRLRKHQLLRFPIFQEPEFLKALTAAVPALHCAILPRGIEDPLGKLGLDSAPRCDDEFVLKCLNSRPNLNNLEARLPLLKRLLKGDHWFSGYKNEVRYLLHGCQEDSGDLPLYDVSGEDDNESKVLSKVLNHILLQRSQDWRVLSTGALKLLSPDDKGELNVCQMTTSQLEQEISGYVSCLGTLILNEDEQALILKKLFTENSTAFSTWYALPYHKTVDGSPVSIADAENAFLTGTTGIPVPDRISSLVTLLKPDGDLVKTYKDHRIRAYTHWITIEVALKQPKPERFCREILDAILTLGEEFSNAADGHHITACDSLVSRLKSIPWMPLGAAGGTSAPNRVINLAEIQVIVADIVANATWAYLNVHEPGELVPAVRTHQSFTLIQRYLFPSMDSSFDLLCKIVAEAADGYHVGQWPRCNADDDSADNALEHVDIDACVISPDLKNHLPFIDPPMPGLTLLKSIFEIEEYIEYFEEVVLAISSRTDINVLKDAVVSVQQHSAVPDEHTRWLANQLLRECIGEGATAKLLQDVQLLNHKGEWRSCLELCTDRFPQASDDWKIDADQQLIVSRLIHDGECSTGEFGRQDYAAKTTQYDNPATALNEYFTDWEGKVKRELIGVFLALLGDDPGIVELANSHLGSFAPVSSLRGRLHGWVVSQGSAAAGAGEDIHETMAAQRVKIVITRNQGSKIEVLNLLGKPIEVDATQSPTSIFEDKRIRPTLEGNFRMARLQLVAFQIDTKEAAQRLLEDAVRVILDSLYRRPQCKVDELWRLVSDTNQVDVRVAQHVILHNAFFYGKQLALASDSRMVVLCNRWRAIEQQLALDRVERAGSDHDEHAAFLSMMNVHSPKFEELTKELYDLFETDNEFCNDILLAVREKIIQAQYNPQSIPFEIFQNADDALAELRELNGDDVCSHFEVQIDKLAVRWFHAGRPINTTYGTRKNRDQCINLGYDQDLSKMLVLSTSDKNRQAGAVTGKFGLGFKSIFIASDVPRILSGDLSVEIVGGAYPKLLDPANVKRLRERAEAIGALKDRIITVIEAPLTDSVKSNELMEDFRKSAGILPGFAREIRRIGISFEKGAETYEWAARPTPLCSGIDIADVTVPGKPKSIMLKINCDTTNESTVVVGITEHGFEPLPDTLSTFWVTAPVRGAHHGAGFAVNAPFQIDIGRGQLAAGDQNKQMARNIGAGAYKALTNLANAVEHDWQSVRGCVALKEDLSAYDFWFSLWQIYCHASRKDDASGALGEILGNIGLGRLWLEQCLLPTDLQGDYRRTIRFSEVKGLVSGLLTDVYTFNHIARLPAFTHAFPPGSLIKHSIYDKLGRLLDPDTKTPPQVSLLTALDTVFTLQCDHLTAAQIRSIVEPHLESDQNECRDIMKWLGTLEYRSKGGSFQPAKRLLSKTHFSSESTGKAEGFVAEEKRLAAFAPNDNLLSDDYDEEGTFLFRKSRGSLTFVAEDITRWGISATTDEQRRAFLVYTVTGDLRTKMEIASKLTSSWLAAVDKDELKRLNIAVEQWDRILAALGKSTNEAPSTSGKPVPTRTSASNDLLEIYKWWHRDGARHRSDYVAKLYPDGQMLAPLSGEYGQTPRERAAWFVLLLRSALESVGRTKIETPLGFLTQIRDNGWVNWLQHGEGSGTELDAAIDNIIGYLNSQISEIKYYNLIPYYVTTSIVARWIDDYAHSILGINGHTESDAFQPLHFLNPRTNPGNRPGDSDAPPLSPVLGIGACFLLRELSRMGAIRNKMVYPYCFVPNKRVLNILEQCGVEVNATDTRLEQSKDIYEQLFDKLGEKKATFNGSFDIPFQVLAINPKYCPQVDLRHIDNGGSDDDD